ncbi:hypothetical protein [Luteolibacter marinus]|uniref:hypothetical protein n=1 Tax=Luteolibacter marinus TaxID=2776705 RepID=UPI001868CE2A|nr:hypothetical protein [Luteolibacter marinus]
MGTTLEGKTPGGADATFKWLLHVGNAALGTGRRVVTGDGTDTALYLGADKIRIYNAGGVGVTLEPGNATFPRTVTLRDADGEMAFTEDLTALWNDVTDALDDKASLAGATFTGQVQLAAGQAATDANSAMSRGLSDARYAHRSGTVFTPATVVRLDPDNGWSANAAVGGSTATITGKTFYLVASATTGSEAYARLAGFQPFLFSPPGEAVFGADCAFDFSRKFSLSFRIVLHPTSGIPDTTAEGYIRVGHARSLATYGPLTTKGIGIKIANREVVGMVHDGTTLNVGSTPLYSLNESTYRVRVVELIPLGDGSVQFWIDGTLMDTLTGGPTGFTGQEGTGISAMVKNTGTQGFTMIIPSGEMVFQYLD